MDKAEEHAGCIRRLERCSACERFVEDDSHGEDVGAFIKILISARLLGRHIFRRADGCADSRELWAEIQREFNGAKIEKLEVELPFIVAQNEEVFGFEVAMNDEGFVRVFEREGELSAEAKCRAKGEDALALEELA